MQLGLSYLRTDALTKVTGLAKYADDISMVGMLYAKYVRSTIAYGYVNEIDYSEALTLPGVVNIFTRQDVPQIPFATAGHAWTLDTKKRDIADRLLLTRHVRHFGDGIVIVVARDELTAEEAAATVKITYEQLPVITCPESAKAADAINIHSNSNLLKHNQITANEPISAIEKSPHQFSKRFTTPIVQHCHMENVTSFAWMEQSDSIIIVSSTQIPHIVRRIVAQALDMSWSKIRVIKPHVGCGFGKKQDVLEEPIAAFLTLKLGGVPVKVMLSREECFYASRTRHAFRIDAKLGITTDVEL
uniref:Xanthine dehydrogenase molybdenum-binding subunit n=1 Tax=Arsenophonus endosymbiont of Trialeurodes vaporariorum TaxID=235567 RepID=A0A3B0LWV6_9GAMM